MINIYPKNSIEHLKFSNVKCMFLKKNKLGPVKKFSSYIKELLWIMKNLE
jgi:hypothetical protein